jgi:hypothetical protein
MIEEAPAPEGDDECLSAKEAAELLDVGLGFVYKWRRSGILPTRFDTLPGSNRRTYYFRYEDLARMEEQHERRIRRHLPCTSNTRRTRPS